MANPFKVFSVALFSKNNEDNFEIKQAERLGEIVANTAEINVGIRNKVHIDAAKAREAAAIKIET